MKKIISIVLLVILGATLSIGIISYVRGGLVYNWFNPEAEIEDTQKNETNKDEQDDNNSQTPSETEIIGVKFSQEELAEKCDLYNETKTVDEESITYETYTSPYDFTLTLYGYDEFDSLTPYNDVIEVEITPVGYAIFDTYGGINSEHEEIIQPASNFEHILNVKVFGNEIRFEVEAIENSKALFTDMVDDSDDVYTGPFIRFDENVKPYFEITLKTADGDLTFNFLPSYGIK